MSQKVIVVEGIEKGKEKKTFEEREIKNEINMNKTKILSLKKIKLIILSIIIILGLFFFVSYFFLSSQPKENINIVNDDSIEELRKTDLMEKEFSKREESIKTDSSQKELIKPVEPTDRESIIREPTIIEPNPKELIITEVNDYEKKVLLITNYFSKTKNPKLILPQTIYIRYYHKLKQLK